MDPTTTFRPEELLKHVTWLRRLAATLVVDAARADDVAQQALLDALARPPREVDHPRAWLASIARNVARALDRSERRRAAHERAAPPRHPAPPTDELVAKTALHHEVVGAVLALAEPYRTVVLLRFFEDRKPGAIAARLTIPVETVRTQLRRGLELLRAELIRHRSISASPSDARRQWPLALLELVAPGDRSALRRAIAEAGPGSFPVPFTGTAGARLVSVRTKLVAAALVVVVASSASWLALQHEAASVGALITEAAPLQAPPIVADADASRTAAPPPPTRTPMALPSDPIRVQLVDPEGLSVADVEVGVAEATDRPQPVDAAVPFVPVAIARSDAAGECRIELPPPLDDRLVDLLATADGFVPGWWPRARAGDVVRLRLVRAAALSGTVRDFEGRPIAGALIRSVLHGPRRFETETTSGSDGRYRLAPWPGPLVEFGEADRAPAWLTIAAGGFAPLHFWAFDNVGELENGEFRCDPWLGRGATIRGRVIDAATRTPVADAEVWIRPWDPRVVDRALARTRTASDGTFALDHVTAWGVQLVGLPSPDLMSRQLGTLCAAAPGRASARRRLAVPDEGDDRTIELALAALGSVRGRVLDPEGRPLPGAIVAAQDEIGELASIAGEAAAASSTATSDADGRYELTGLALIHGAATVATLEASMATGAATAFHFSPVQVELAAGRCVDAPDLVARARSGLLVHVVAESGHPVAGAELCKWLRTERGPRFEDGVLTRETGSSGHCFLPAPAAAEAMRTTSLSVKATGFATTVLELASEHGMLTIKLPPEHRLAGTVRDVDGRPGTATVLVVPAVDAPVELEHALRSGTFMDRLPWPALDQAQAREGRFAIRGLGAGSWHVAAFRHSGQERPEVVIVPDVSEETAEVELVLPGSGIATGEPASREPCASGYVEVTLLDPGSGRPFSGASLVTLKSGDSLVYGKRGAPGRVDFGEIPAGRWELLASTATSPPVTRTIEVADGSTTRVGMPLAAGTVARGRVDLGLLRPFESASVVLEPEEGGRGGVGDLARDGTFEVRGLLADARYRMWLRTRVGDEMRFWVAEGEPRSAESIAAGSPHLVPAGVLVARFAVRGRMPDGAVLRVHDRSGRLVYERNPARESGFERVLPAGDYVVTADVPGLAPQHKHTALPAHGRTIQLQFAAE